MRKWLLPTIVILAGVLLVPFAWNRLRPAALPDTFAGSNGRIEAVEVDVATKTAGRLTEVLAKEGDFVTAGQVLARMDTDVLEAELSEARAEFRRAEAAIDTARSQVAQRESEKGAARSLQAQREAECEIAQRTRDRVQKLHEKGAATEQTLDEARASLFGAEAAVKAAEANVAAAEAAIATAKSQVIQAEAAVNASEAKIQRIEADIDDSTLRSPRDGRVQYRIAEPGEVLGAGGKVLNLVDLGDVYMTFFLPTASAGRLTMGAEARVVLDAAPQYVIPARISFVADVAQFTPKTVETLEERQKLMFRIKAQIDPDVLKKHIRSVKTGLPGMAYVQLDPRSAWPARLEVRLPL